MRIQHSRRSFVGALAAAGTAIGLKSDRATAGTTEPLAILGGPPVRNAKQPFFSWPVTTEADERTWMDVLKKGKWCRLNGDYANRFEESWAQKLGASIARPSPMEQVR